MKRSAGILAAWALCLAVAAPTGAFAAGKPEVVAFYQAYMGMVSASDYVPLSRDQPKTWDAKFDAAAQNAGFEDAAAALAAGDAYAADSDVAALRKAVADKILEQYKPYQE